MAKKYVVDLEEDEKAELVALTQKGRPGARKITRHNPFVGSVFEAFPPEQARLLTRKLEFHYTPEHSSWLNMAEVEISVLTEQCLDRRLGSEKS